MALGGLLTPPGMFSGIDVMKNVYLWSSWHVFESASRSKISPLWRCSVSLLAQKMSFTWQSKTSDRALPDRYGRFPFRRWGKVRIGAYAPIGMPHPPSRYSWTETSPGVGNT